VLYTKLYVTEQRKDEDYDDVVEENLLNEVSAIAADVFFFTNITVFIIK